MEFEIFHYFPMRGKMPRLRDFVTMPLRDFVTMPHIRDFVTMPHIRDFVAMPRMQGSVTYSVVNVGKFYSIWEGLTI